MKILRTASLGSNFIGSYKKEECIYTRYEVLFYLWCIKLAWKNSKLQRYMSLFPINLSKRTASIRKFFLTKYLSVSLS